LAVAYGWRSDGLALSSLLSGFVPTLNASETVPAPEPAVATAGEPIANASEESVASLTPAGQADAAVVERGKTVATTKLVVADTAGEALQYIPLSIRTDSSSGADQLAIRLSGLPTETVLTSGEDLGNGTWLLKPGEQQDLKLAVQSNAPRAIVIGVEAIEMITGELAAPPQDLRVNILPPKVYVQPAADTIKPAIVPAAESPAVEAPPAAVKIASAPELPPLPSVDEAAADTSVKAVATEPEVVPEPEARAAAAQPAVDTEPPPAAAKPAPEPQPEVKVAAADPLVVSTMEPYEAAAPAEAAGAQSTLISRGDTLMSMGEVIGARSFYNRAFTRGDMSAARSIGRTFDPVVYAELNVMGLKPDAKKALEWYRKAEAAGISDARSDIAALENYLASR
jgi:hypothetical protein